jgi:hypothetical protein
MGAGLTYAEGGFEWFGVGGVVVRRSADSLYI